MVTNQSVQEGKEPTLTIPHRTSMGLKQPRLGVEEVGPAKMWFIYGETLLLGLTGRSLSCDSCLAPTRKGISPTPQRGRRALIKCGKAFIPTDIDSVGAILV